MHKFKNKASAHLHEKLRRSFIPKLDNWKEAWLTCGHQRWWEMEKQCEQCHHYSIYDAIVRERQVIASTSVDEARAIVSAEVRKLRGIYHNFLEIVRARWPYDLNELNESKLEAHPMFALCDDDDCLICTVDPATHSSLRSTAEALLELVEQEERLALPDDQIKELVESERIQKRVQRIMDMIKIWEARWDRTWVGIPEGWISRSPDADNGSWDWSSSEDEFENEEFFDGEVDM